MAVSTSLRPSRAATLTGFLYRPEVRQAVYQVLLLAAIAFAAWWVVNNVAENLRRQNIASGFDFLGRTSGFDVSQIADRVFQRLHLRPRLLGGPAQHPAGGGARHCRRDGHRLRRRHRPAVSNWLIAQLATAYVEVVRNLPLLLQLFFWYFAVLKNLPGPRQSYVLPGGASSMCGGSICRRPCRSPASSWSPSPSGRRARRHRPVAVGPAAPGADRATLPRALDRAAGDRRVAAGCLSSPPAVPLGFEYPELKGFNFQGGIAVLPELMALLLGLSIYTASFIAEIVRAGILGVPKGQTEAAQAVGLSKGQTLRLVVIPQASRIIIPPLTSQYLNLTKNSSLAVAIGYPDFVSVFTGTVLNQTGQAVEVILMTMGVFLTLSLLTSLFMNWFNRRMALVER